MKKAKKVLKSKNRLPSLMIVGQTGGGKTAFCNEIVNHMLFKEMLKGSGNNRTTKVITQFILKE